MTDLIRVNDLKVDMVLPEGRVEAVRGVSFRIRAGATTALVGESGAGKSVIGQAIMGILPKTGRIVGGEILFADPKRDGEVTDIARLNPDGRAMRAIRGGRISIIFQEPMTSLSPLHTVGDQVSECLRLHRTVGAREAMELCADMLRMVSFPEPEQGLRSYPFELSGGLRQRAMIAMALVCRPALLIADEPTTALDVTIQAQILKLINDLQAELGMAVLIITHDLGVVANMAEEVVVIYHGRVMESGTLDDIFRNARHPYLKALLRAVPRFHMEPDERLVPIREITHQPGGLLMAANEPRPATDATKPLLEVRNLTKTYRMRDSLFRWLRAGPAALPAVRDVSLEINRGECLGLVGESGCGKTTLAKLLMRAITPDAGEIVINDGGRAVDVRALEGKELMAFRRKIQLIFQDPFGSLNPRMTVFDIISEPLEIHRIGDAESRIETVRELMRVVGLDVRHLRRYPHSFSGGQRQRVGIARALALKPDLLICDEPVSALDVSIQAQILNLLKDLQKELGLTYLFISHNLAVVDYVAARIMVMCQGRVVETAPREVLFDRPLHPYTRALLTAVPEPDPDHRLDLTALMQGRASTPSEWPHPFTDLGDLGDLDGAREPTLIDMGGGHFVRALEPPAARGSAA